MQLHKQQCAIYSAAASGETPASIQRICTTYLNRGRDGLPNHQ